MINIHQITIQIQMLVLSHLNRSIRWFVGLGAWWEVEFGEDSVGWEGYFGEGLGGEVRGVAGEDNFLD